MAAAGLSAGRVLAVFEGLEAGKDEATIARDYGIKLEKVQAVAAFFQREAVDSPNNGEDDSGKDNGEAGADDGTQSPEDPASVAPVTESEPCGW